MTRLHTHLHAPLAALLACTLAACGGGDDNPSPAGGSGGGGGTLTLSAATPGSHNTTLDLATATTSGNSARAADSFSSVPYCEVFWENVRGANGTTYAVQVYFRQGDKLPMHVSVLGGAAASAWSVFDNASGAAIANITVSTTARTVVFASKALSNGAGSLATLTGTANFGPNSTVPACGA
jgi:hypothetical protein